MREHVQYDKSAKTAAEKLFNDYFMCFAVAERIQHDQEGEFQNQLFNLLEQLCHLGRSMTKSNYFNRNQS